MSEGVFTLAQEARLRTLIDAAVDLAVAACPGDTPRLLCKLAFMRAELQIGTFADLPMDERLTQISRLAMDQANAEAGITSDLSRDG